MLFPSLLIPSCQTACSPCETPDCSIRASVLCEFELVTLTWSTKAETGAVYRLTGPGLDEAVGRSGSRTETLIQGSASTYTITTYVNGLPIRACDVVVDRFCGCPIFLPGTVRAAYTVEFDVAASADCGNCDDLRCPDISGAFGVGNGSGSNSGCSWNGGPFGSNVSCNLADLSPRNYSPFTVSLHAQSLHPMTNVYDGNWYAVAQQSYPVVDPHLTCLGAVGGYKLLGADADKPFDGALLVDSYTQIIASSTMCIGTVEVS